MNVVLDLDRAEACIVRDALRDYQRAKRNRVRRLNEKPHSYRAQHWLHIHAGDAMLATRVLKQLDEKTGHV